MSLVPFGFFDEPFREMRRMLSRMDSLLGRELGLETADSLALNVSEDEHNIMVEASLPGFREDEIDVQVTNDILTISARHEEKQEEQDEGRRWHVVEQRYSSLTRSLRIPEGIATDKIEAELENGVLTLTLPKQQPGPLQRIAVKVKKALPNGSKKK